MKYKAIIFDLDGTIVDTENIWQQATKEFITSRNITLTPELEEELHRQLRGFGLEKSCIYLKEKFGLPEELIHLVEEKSKRAMALYEKEIKFIEGFTSFHPQLNRHQVYHGIATNADDTTLITTKKALNLEHYFGEHIYGISSVNNIAKPDPAIYLHVADKLQMKSEDCIAIEDSVHGVQAAKNAGMFCIGINSSKDRKFIEGCDIIVENYHEVDLQEILKKKK